MRRGQKQVISRAEFQISYCIFALNNYQKEHKAWVSYEPRRLVCRQSYQFNNEYVLLQYKRSGLGHIETIVSDVFLYLVLFQMQH